jgi:hypothetical protein
VCRNGYPIISLSLFWEVRIDEVMSRASFDKYSGFAISRDCQMSRR